MWVFDHAQFLGKSHGTRGHSALQYNGRDALLASKLNEAAHNPRTEPLARWPHFDLGTDQAILFWPEAKVEMNAFAGEIEVAAQSRAAFDGLAEFLSEHLAERFDCPD